MLSNRYKRIPLSAIKFDRAGRQRTKIEIDPEMLESIRLRGVLVPIIVEDLGDGTFLLIAGERRLTHAIALNHEDIPARLGSALSEEDRKIIELEENVRRLDLPWQDNIRAVQQLHAIKSATQPDWTPVQTGEFLGINSQSYIYRMLKVCEFLNNKAVAEASSFIAAFNIVDRLERRAIDDALNEVSTATIGATVAAIAKPTSNGQAQSSPAPVPARPLLVPSDHSILIADFHEFAETYSDVPFNLIHCDFPYGVNMQDSDQGNTSAWGGYDDTPEIYFALLSTLCRKIDNIMSRSGHMLFWFSMNYYRETLEFFAQNAPSLNVDPFPLIWLKSDNKGILPDPKRSCRRIYETALLISRGDRFLIKSVSNAYAAPTAGNARLHQSEKPEPVLRHFFQMFVDNSTRLLDPTAGSGSALRAAESLGAGFTLGLERDPEHAGVARAALQSFRAKRALAGV